MGALVASFIVITIAALGYNPIIYCANIPKHVSKSTHCLSALSLSLPPSLPPSPLPPLGVAAGGVSGGLLGRKIYKSTLPPEEIELKEVKKTE